MNRVLEVTIDGAKYRVSAERDAEDALAEFQQMMREGAVSELRLAGGRPLVVNWGRVAAVSVVEADSRDEEFTYSGRSTERRWPQRPF